MAQHLAQSLLLQVPKIINYYPSIHCFNSHLKKYIIKPFMYEGFVSQIKYHTTCAVCQNIQVLSLLKIPNRVNKKLGKSTICFVIFIFGNYNCIYFFDVYILSSPQEGWQVLQHVKQKGMRTKGTSCNIPAFKRILHYFLTFLQALLQSNSKLKTFL